MQLRPPEAFDFDFLYHLSISESAGFRWRYRGMIPSQEAYRSQFWQDILAQFVVVSRERSEPVGLVAAYGADLRSGFTYIAQLMSESYLRSGLSVEAGLLFVNYLFDNWNFRKLYGEVPGFNMSSLSSGAGKNFREEARLPAHHFYQGKYWDQHIVALYREDWESLRDRYMQRLLMSRATAAERSA